MILDDRIEKIVTYASNHVPYYKKEYEIFKINNTFNKKKFTSLPFLDKNILRKNLDSFLSTEYKKKELFNEMTSGSTGQSLIIYKSRLERAKAGYELWNSRRKWVNNILLLPMVKFSAREFNDSNINGGNIINIPLINLNEKVFEKIFEKISKINHLWIFGPPSAVYKLGQYCVRFKQDQLKKIKFIELSGEILLPLHLQKIKEVFNCPVVNQYGSKEFWGIAYECKNGKQHILDNHVYVEIINEQGNPATYGEIGEVVITGLQQFSMPLIRYRIGDRARLIKSDCVCGNNADIIEIVGGRTTDYIKTKIPDNCYNPVVFCVFVEKLNDLIGSHDRYIEQFQIIQKSLMNFEINLTTKGNIDKPIIERKFQEMFSNYLGTKILLNFKYPEQIPQDNLSGKYKYFISQV